MGTTKNNQSVKNQSVKNQSARTKSWVAQSCKLGAQLQALWFEKDSRLVDKNGKDLGCTKYEHACSLGLYPHYVGKNKVAKAYGPAEFNKAIISNGGGDELLDREGDKVVATYVYRARNVNVELIEEDSEEGSSVYPIYTLEEAEKKAKGETGANAIKVWSRVQIDECGWGPGLIGTVLTQSKNITTYTNKAAKSCEDYAAIERVYIVKNINGVNTVIEVEKPELTF